jgi:phosphoesterase RecJ-like protein
MIISLVDALGVPMDREIALPLLTGIVMDTRGFRTSNTTSDTLRAASRLMDVGASLSEVMERALNSRPYAMLCLWGKMLATVHLEGRIAWAVLTPAMQAECGNPEEGDGGFINLLVSLQEADVGLLFYDKGDHAVEVGFRAKPGIDISGVAFALGGGGHPQAAGCTVEGSLEEVRARVLDMVRRAIDGQRALYR